MQQHATFPPANIQRTQRKVGWTTTTEDNIVVFFLILVTWKHVKKKVMNFYVRRDHLVWLKLKLQFLWKNRQIIIGFMVKWAVVRACWSSKSERIYKTIQWKIWHGSVVLNVEIVACLKSLLQVHGYVKGLCKSVASWFTRCDTHAIC